MSFCPVLDIEEQAIYNLYVSKRRQASKHNIFKGICRCHLFFPRTDTERAVTTDNHTLLLVTSTPIRRKNHYMFVSRVLGTTESIFEDSSRVKTSTIKTKTLIHSPAIYWEYHISYHCWKKSVCSAFPFQKVVGERKKIGLPESVAFLYW